MRHPQDTAAQSLSRHCEKRKELHLVINDCGKVFSFCLTPGNADDRNRKVIKHLTKDLFRKLFADKGDVSKKLLKELLKQRVELITT